MTSLGGPQYTDAMRYDLEGRLVKRREWAELAGPLHDDSIAYDARGKQTYVSVGAAGGRQPSQYWQWYSGIGMLVGTDWRNEADNGRAQEAYGTDALGNVAWRRSDDGGGGTAHIRWDQAYQAGLGRLRTMESVNTGHPSADFHPEKTTRFYDAAGNTDWTILSQMGDVGAGTTGVVRDKRSRTSACPKFGSYVCNPSRAKYCDWAIRLGCGVLGSVSQPNPVRDDETAVNRGHCPSVSHGV